MPGVVIYETVYWIGAGILNVRAESALQYPQKQEIAQLELNFVKLNKNAPLWRVTIIKLLPTLIGASIVWMVAFNIFDILTVLAKAQIGTLAALQDALTYLLYRTDFWLWFYFTFTVGNTMLPDLKEFRPLGFIVIPAVSIAIILAFMGVGNAVVVTTIRGPITDFINVVSGILLMIIVIDLIMVIILATIENTIEYITGDSADFVNGKLIAMTRKERLAKRERDLQKQRAQLSEKRAQRLTSSVLSSIYQHPLPIPGAPGIIPITPIHTVMFEKSSAPLLKERLERAGATLIESQSETPES